MPHHRAHHHLAHHVDAGVPFRNLPRYHRLLADAGYVTARVEGVAGETQGYEYPTYISLWRTLHT